MIPFGHVLDRAALPGPLGATDCRCITLVEDCHAATLAWCSPTTYVPEGHVVVVMWCGPTTSGAHRALGALISGYPARRATYGGADHPGCDG